MGHPKNTAQAQSYPKFRTPYNYSEEYIREYSLILKEEEKPFSAFSRPTMLIVEEIRVFELHRPGLEL